jgi:hypothetical protein
MFRLELLQRRKKLFLRRCSKGRRLAAGDDGPVREARRHEEVISDQLPVINRKLATGNWQLATDN